VAKPADQKIKEKLQAVRESEEEQVTQILSQKYKIPYIDLTKMTIDLDSLRIIPEEDARLARIAIFQGVGKKLEVAMKNPEDQLTKNWIKKLEKDGYQVKRYLVSTKSLEKAWERYKEATEYQEATKGIVEISPERVEELKKELVSIEKIKEIFLARTQSREPRKISGLLEILFSGSLGSGASDIHLEPFADFIKLRLRLDGVLHDILKFNKSVYKLLLSRIKLVSGMKLNISEKPQDGRLTFKTKESEIEVRVSTLPGPYGETIVMRVLNPKTISISFEELGMEPYFQKIMEKEIHRPNGMILTTGPTGSGKTTTLYAILKKIRKPEIKIITLEDPIEYRLEGISQTQVDVGRGYTFASGLRSILRQDPDVIMVGEIRDLAPAKTALNAALTGHLVLSTLHTNNAAGTIPRLIDIGANPAIIAPAINVSMAQRLVRKLCSCKEPYDPTADQKKLIEEVVATLPETVQKPKTSVLKLYKPVGCEKCSQIGYKGRVGIFEAILIDDPMQELILKNPTETQIKKEARRQGIVNMKQDAVLKIIKGITSLEEARRVIEL
jgi:type IV pilus assembly protein PilB